jgi:outer membrane immunogenic protein
MKRVILAIVFGAVATSANAADLPERAYVKAPAIAPTTSWGGLYAGATLGARWTDAKWTLTNFTGAGAGDPAEGPNGVGVNSTAARIGGLVGYNWQVSPIYVLGVEADFAWADNKASLAGFPGAQLSDIGNDTVSVKLGWDASIRARFGALLTPSTLLYLTGGVAWQEIKTDTFCQNTSGLCSQGGTAFAGSTSATKTGWTVGAGVETLLWSKWTARAEYRYSDFGKAAAFLPPAPNTGFDATVDVKTHTALVGIAYKFN